MSRQFVRASSQYLNIASGLSTPIGMTVSLWFKLASTANNQVLFSLVNNSSDDGLYLLYRGATSSKICAASNDGGVAFAEAVGTANANNTNWQHACAVFGSSGTIRYVIHNGSITSNSTTVVPSDLNNIYLGKYSAASTSYVDGVIAEVGLWSVPLLDTEAFALSKGMSPSRIRPQSLVDHWPLYGRTTDEIGMRGNVLTVTGATHADHPRIFR